MRFLPAGDRGLIAECGEGIDPAVNDQVHLLAALLERAAIPGVLAVVPTYRSVGVAFDPAQISGADLRARIEALLSQPDAEARPACKLVPLPTVYGGSYGPDLPFVAEHAGLSQDDVIRIHSGAEYRVYMIGFTAGFAYLGGLPERIQTPRLPTPRIRTPRGSVGIGGSQTGAYPADTPGGWRLIGRTPLTLFDPTREPPTPMLPGDRVRFVPIPEAEFRRLEQEATRGASREPRATGEGSAEHRAPGAESGPESCEVRAAGEGSAQRPAPGAESIIGTGGSCREQQEGAGRSDPSRRSGPGTRCPVPGARCFVEVLRPGLLTTVQDRGRIGTQKFGVPVSGAMDEVALRVGNVLVGNPQDAAGLEITVTGPALCFLSETVVALTGAEMDADLDGQPIPWYESFRVRGGQTLDLRSCRTGFRAYLTLAGGIEVPLVLGSRSTCLVAGFGGGTGRALREGDRLPIGSPAGATAGSVAARRWRAGHEQPVTVRVVLGPEDAAFTAEGRETFLHAVYEVTPQVDRMGCRLDGPAIAHAGPADILSDWIPPGGVQVPGEGRPIILLADRQTTGGYTKIATVIGADLGLVAQQRPGGRIRFQAVTPEAAEAIARRLEADLAGLSSRLVDGGLWQVLADTGEIPDAPTARTAAVQTTGGAP
jgi:KipI family sensor histidine kinase inhibitor